jgi:ribonucleoside-diphosphate reductase alpha chain
VTVYRDNSRKNQVFSATDVGEELDSVALGPRPRVRVTAGKTSKFRMGCGTLFVTVNRDDKGVCEVFANLGNAGGCPAQSEATCRTVSAALRSGVDPRVMIDQLSRIRCLSAAVARKSGRGVDVLSCPDAIARALQEALDGTEPAQERWHDKKCPECGLTLRFESGCDVCDCGYSSCG